MADSTSNAGLRHSRLHEYEKRYGPYAFGVGSLLLIWSYVVAPELRSSRGDAAVLLRAAEENRHVAQSLARTGEALERAAYQLQTVAEAQKIISETLRGTVERLGAIDRARP